MQTKVKVIAETGSNFTSLDDCLNSIAMARLSGADAVKFQLYDAESLYGFESHKDDKRWWLDPEWLPKLKEKADKCDIEFMCTAFSPRGAKLVNEFVDTHKVASAEMLHLELLETLLQTKKPIYISTGAHNKHEIDSLIAFCQSADITLMHCVASYPAHDANLGRIKALRDTYKLPVGYSDHTIDSTTIPRLAVEMGATVIEKHFKIKDMFTPDNSHSLLPDQFAKMVKSIKEGNPVSLEPLTDETPMIMRHNRRLIAIKDIEPEQRLVLNVNYGCYRSRNDEPFALGPAEIHAVEGVTVNSRIARGEGIAHRHLRGEVLA